MKGVTKCSKCGYKAKKQKEVCKIGNKQICKKCLKERRKERREYLKRKILGIRTKKQQIEDRKKERENKPYIKPTKKTLTKQTKKKLRILYLNKPEINVLYKKLKDKLPSKEIKERIKNLKLQMEITKEKIKQMDLPEKETNQKFLEEYNKLIEKATR